MPYRYSILNIKSYIYPNDEPELDRQDMQHHMWKIILDVGTGSGIWPIELAAYFPNAEITGTDLSPVQPTNVPDNVHFYIDDAMETDWLWPENHFDYIHASMLSGSFRSFDDLLRTAYRYLKPGGWIECHDVDIAIRCDDGSVPTDAMDSWGPYQFQNWITLLTKATSTMDSPRPIRSAHYISKWMREIGFKNIQESVRKIPITPWHKDPYLREIGEWNQMNWLEGLAALSWVPFGERGLGWTRQEIEVFLVDVRKSLLNLDYHAYNNLHVVIARKPFC
ncbi:hypothetical protein FQN55_006753 [Onygenales sp. PD_40]|nr:hypothetical protein FQN55_006753 [Onygenales sp. PD_40]